MARRQFQCSSIKFPVSFFFFFFSFGLDEGRMASWIRHISLFVLSVFFSPFHYFTKSQKCEKKDEIDVNHAFLVQDEKHLRMSTRLYRSPGFKAFATLVFPEIRNRFPPTLSSPSLSPSYSPHFLSFPLDIRHSFACNLFKSNSNFFFFVFIIQL